MKDPTRLRFPRPQFLAAALGILALAVASVVHAQSPNLLMGNPSDATTTEADADNYLMDKTYFTLSYNNSNGTPNWVSWRLVASDIGKTKRSNPFHPDSELPSSFQQIIPSDYTGTGFDRGHMCNFKDRSSSDATAQATFVMTNMVPQSPRLNEHTWERLEDYCRTLAQKGKHLYIVAGPAGRGGQGLIKPTTITKAEAFGGPKSNKVTVPSECWKVILVVDGSNGDDDLKKVDKDTRLIAIIMPNNQSLSLDWTGFRVSVHEVEKLTGYKFFTSVPEQVVEPLKDKVDAEMN